MSNLTQMAQGAKKIVLNGIIITTTSEPNISNGHNAIRVYFNITAGAGTWTIKVQGKSPNDTYTDCYDSNGTQMIMSSLTADRGQSFVCLPDKFRIVATEDSDGATIDVSYELFSV